MLKVATRYWSQGMIHTNGIMKIAPEIPFRIFISVWGGPEQTQSWRGVNSYQKALGTASQDPRAIINYTVNAKNIDDILIVARDCHQQNLNLTFQVYSPTADYRDYIGSGTVGRHKYIQSKSPQENLIMSKHDDLRAEREICKAIDTFPDTVIFTKALAKFVFEKPGIFFGNTNVSLVPHGCVAGNSASHHHVLIGGQKAMGKTCGHGAVSCNTCRTYTSIYPGFFKAKLSQQMGKADAIDFLEAHNVFDILYNG
ncbi:hypothetical protein [Flexibacterium corallicola]|uniref:hypothetical protein n=1 Tax=Flexibacterium corallicola TaxID=3037259 RepID=UPI00286F39B9|nr:hypothetical protein [Pseudovibrio sp. M1P-2-3]